VFDPFSIDQCGEVDKISEHATVLIPFYFLPLFILLGIVAKKFVAEMKQRISNAR